MCIRYSTGLGYRDTAQDAMTIPHSNPEKCRQRIVELLRGLTTKGYGLHPVSYTHLDVYKRQMQDYEMTTIDADMEEYVLGTDEITYTDSAYSAPMMTSVAYQCVVLRVPDGTDVPKAKQTLLDNANPAKWICVEAESVAVESIGDVILYVMGFDEDVSAIKDAFLALDE